MSPELDDYFTCQCVFEDDKLENARKQMVLHRVPVDCRDEDYWRRGWKLVTHYQELWNDPDKLIGRYGELLEGDAGDYGQYY